MSALTRRVLEECPSLLTTPSVQVHIWKWVFRGDPQSGAANRRCGVGPPEYVPKYVNCMCTLPVGTVRTRWLGFEL